MLKSLNDMTPEEFLEVERLAALYFTPREIALMLQLKFEEVLLEMDADQGNFYNAFLTGRLQAEVDIRKGIIQLAKAGSSPAQTMAMDLFNKSKAKMLDR